MATEVAGMVGLAKMAMVTVAVVARRAASRVIPLARLAVLGVMGQGGGSGLAPGSRGGGVHGAFRQAAASIFLLRLGGGGISPECCNMRDTCRNFLV